jgi:hypothetical protein
LVPVLFRSVNLSHENLISTVVLVCAQDQMPRTTARSITADVPHHGAGHLSALVKRPILFVNKCWDILLTGEHVRQAMRALRPSCYGTSPVTCIPNAASPYPATIDLFVYVAPEFGLPLWCEPLAKLRIVNGVCSEGFEKIAYVGHS